MIPMATPAGRIFVITLRAKPDSLGRPAAVRLRKMLKSALRGLALQCVGLSELHTDGQESAIDPDAD